MKNNMNRKLLTIGLIMIMATSTVFAGTMPIPNVQNNIGDVLKATGEVMNSVAEPYSRWVKRTETVYENKPFTVYNDNETRKVVGVESKYSVYQVYTGYPSRKIHVHDKYEMVWTGYKKNSNNTWSVVPGYEDIEETVIDRGPLAELFGDVLLT